MEQLYIQVLKKKLFSLMATCYYLGPWFSGVYLLATTTSSSVNKMTFAELSKVAAKENSKEMSAGIKAYGVGPGVGGKNQKKEEVDINLYDWTIQ